MQNQSKPLRKAVYSGTFDPLTFGHEDVICRSAALFDEVIVAVAMAHHKKTRFALAQRVAFLQAFATQNESKGFRITAMPFDGLIVDFCRAQGANTIVRGIRNQTDFDYERQMAEMNHKLAGVETVFLVPHPSVQCISSTLVREISQLGGDVSQLVNAQVLQALKPPVLQA